jgi:hypothetical protein
MGSGTKGSISSPEHDEIRSCPSSGGARVERKRTQEASSGLLRTALVGGESFEDPVGGELLRVYHSVHQRRETGSSEADAIVQASDDPAEWLKSKGVWQRDVIGKESRRGDIRV